MANTFLDTSNRSIRDDFEQTPPSEYLSLKKFRDYSVEYAYPASGGEADLFRLEKDNQKYIGKLYRKGIVPNEEILKIISQICKKYPDNFVQLLEYGLDPTTNLWFEILQFETHGSLREFLDNQSNSVLNLDIRNVIEQIFRSISIIHQYQILHLDLKPENILVRSSNPVTLVLTDFGVSSILPANIISKMSRRKGTPEYWAPEQLSGIVGKKTDYWALGIITLELLTSQSLFKNIDQKKIECELSTKGVKIPADIPQGYSHLLRGLLTRDPEKRWGELEVSRWLQGDTNIAEYYEYHDTSDPKQNIKPIKFHGHQYYSLEDLVAAFIESPEAWDEAGTYLGRNYIRNWLEGNGDYDKAILLENKEGKKIDWNWELFNFIYNVNKKLPFSILGKIIDESNLYLYLGKYLRKENTDPEGWIILSWEDGELNRYAQKYAELTGEQPSVVKAIFLTTGIKPHSLFSLFDLLNHPEKYHLPGVIDENKPLETLRITSLPTKERDVLPIFSNKEFDDYNEEYLIPDYLLEKINSDEFYEAYDEIIKLKNKGMNRRELNSLRSRFLIPDYLMAMVRSDKFLQAYNEIKNLERIAFTRKQIQDLETEFDLPLEITLQFNSENYENAYRNLDNYRRENLLLRKSRANGSNLPSNEFDDSDLNQNSRKHGKYYIDTAKQANWGIDVDEIPKLKKMRDLDLNPELNRYLDRLLSMNFPWTLDDKKILNNVWNRIQTTEKYSFLLQPLFLINIYLALIGSCIGTFILLFKKDWVLQTFIFTANKNIAIIVLLAIIGIYIILKYSAKTEDNIIRELSSAYHIRQYIVEWIVSVFYICCIYSFFLFLNTREMVWTEIYVNWLIGDHTLLLTLIFVIFAIGLFLLILLITIRLFKRFLIRWKMKKTISLIVSANRDTIREMYRENGKIEIVGNK